MSKSNRVPIRLAEGQPTQCLPAFGQCEGGGTIEVTGDVAEALCARDEWSRVGGAAAESKAEPKAGPVAGQTAKGGGGK